MDPTSSQSNEPLLQVRDLRVSLPTVAGRVDALRGVSFTLERGQTLGLIGESGCGKSLTALAVMGLLPEQAVVSGSIRLHGTEMVGMSEDAWCALRGNRMAMVFQEPMTALNPLMPIWRQIAEPMRIHRDTGVDEARERALQLLERVQLPRARERLDAYPHQLSGGQRQRVMISMALACSPDILIADEPTTALDVTVQKEVPALISELVREDRMALLLISHDLALMRDQVQQVMVMYGGSVVEGGPVDALFTQRTHPYTRGLMGARARLDLPRGQRLPSIVGTVPDLASLPVGCAFAARCPLVVPACREKFPELQTVSAATPHALAHQVRCPRWKEQA